LLGIIALTPLYLSYNDKLIKRVDLACFSKDVSTAADFEWRCPLCGQTCAEENPVTVDKLMMSIIESHQPSEMKEFFQVTSDGQLCDDSQSENSDSEEMEGKINDNGA
jgi:hypothetical protein